MEWLVLSNLASGALGFGAKAFLDQDQSRKSDLRDRVDKISNTIKARADMAVFYWCSTVNDADTLKMAELMKAARREISKEIDQLSGYVSNSTGDWTNKLIAFQRAMTGGNFEVMTRTYEPLRCKRILEAKTDLIIAIRKRFGII